MNDVTVYQTRFNVGSFKGSESLRDIISDVARNEKRFWQVAGIGEYTTIINYTNPDVLSYLVLKYDSLVDRTLEVTVPYAKFVLGDYYFRG